MANTPKKQENSDDMLAALEDALSINEHKSTDEKSAPGKTEEAAASASPVIMPPPPSPDDHIFAERPSAPVSRSTRTPKGAANDDRQSVGQILANMHRKPSTMPYVIAGVASIAWATAQFFYAHARFAQEFAALKGITQLVDQPFFVPLVALSCFRLPASSLSR